MNARIPCEFFLIRYTPDAVKGEFINIGVILREVATPQQRRGAATQVRFTRDWRRVRCIDPGADIPLLESLEAEIAGLLLSEATGPAPPLPLLDVLSDTLSNAIQITEPRGTLAESFSLELEQLMGLYIEPIRTKVTREPTGRAAISTAMRRQFERTGVWPLMRKRIAVAPYTRKGDPMKLDCGYRPDSRSESTTEPRLGGGSIRIFHAVSLEDNVESAKSLAYSAPQLREGFLREENAALDLAAVVEPIPDISTGDKPPESFNYDYADLYRFGIDALESAAIRVLTVNDLAHAAETARDELGLRNS